MKFSVLILTALLTSNFNLFGCDYCLLSQGISPLETSGGFGLRLDERHTRLGKFFQNGEPLDGEGALETHWTTQLTLFYSPMPNLTLLASLPYVVRENHKNLPDDHTELTTTTDVKPQGALPAKLFHGEGPLGRATGLSDISLMGRYQFLQRHTLTSTLSAALQAGVRLPSGSTTAVNDRGERFDAHIQPGFGGLALMSGFSLSYAMQQIAFSMNALLGLPAEGEVAGEKYRYGTGLNYDLNARYRLAGGLEKAQNVFAALGISGEHHTPERSNGVEDENTGGHVLYVTPGVQVFFQRFIVELSAWQPIFHSMDGRQLAESLKVLGGLTVLLN